MSPPGSFLTPSPSPSVQSPRLQRSPSQSSFQQDVVLLTNNVISSTHDHVSFFCFNKFSMKRTNYLSFKDRKSLTSQRRLSVNHIGPAGAGIVVHRPSPTQSPASINNIGTEFNTTLVGSNNLSLNKVSLKYSTLKCTVD